jgi:ketosteroid isomerase-like protein
VSCGSAGNCSAGGYYTNGSGHHQVFVVSQVNGTWRTAKEVPGTANLNKGGNANIFSVSCGSAGNCSAGGYYTNGSGHTQAFVVSQVNGIWRTAQKVPGTATLNQGGNAEVNSVSCGSAGNCSAGGSYKDGSWNYQAFVVSQVNGTWHTAIEVPGTAALNVHGDAQVMSLSCASAGNCSAGGQYVDSSWSGQAFVVSQVKGTWHKAIEVPGTAALNKGGAWIVSLSCGSAGNCSAGGTYGDGESSGVATRQVFVVNEVNGTWETAVEVPGTATLNTGGGADMYSVSCASAGNCSVGGSYFTGYSHAFVASQVNGTWRSAVEAPGTAALNQGEIAYAISVSCALAGNCSVGGTYTDSSKHMQAFVVSEVNGTWRTAIEAPGTAALNQGGNAFVQSVSCASARNCSAGGGYTDNSGHRQAFVLSES